MSTVNSNQTEVSFVGREGRQGSTRGGGSGTRAGGRPRRKQKVVGNPMTMVEEEVINLISKTQELYTMVFNARQSTTVKDFFKDLGLAYDLE